MSLWYNNDITRHEGSKIGDVTSQFGLQKIIKEPTLIIGGSLLCIELFFSTLPDLVIESGVYFSLHANCSHHQKFVKFNLKIHYLPPYEREARHYQRTKTNQIKQAISEFPWDNRFANINGNE